MPGEVSCDADWHCVYTGQAIAMIRILHVDMPGEALRARIEANLARHSPELSAIHWCAKRAICTGHAALRDGVA